jgi:hypothetical protein
MPTGRITLSTGMLEANPAARRASPSESKKKLAYLK